MIRLFHLAMFGEKDIYHILILIAACLMFMGTFSFCFRYISVLSYFLTFDLNYKVFLSMDLQGTYSMACLMVSLLKSQIMSCHRLSVLLHTLGYELSKAIWCIRVCVCVCEAAAQQYYLTLSFSLLWFRLDPQPKSRERMHCLSRKRSLLTR